MKMWDTIVTENKQNEITILPFISFVQSTRSTSAIWRTLTRLPVDITKGQLIVVLHQRPPLVVKRRTPSLVEHLYRLSLLPVSTQLIAM